MRVQAPDPKGMRENLIASSRGQYASQVQQTAEDAVKQIDVLLECYTRAILDLDDVRPKKSDPAYAEVIMRRPALATWLYTCSAVPDAVVLHAAHPSKHCN